MITEGPLEVILADRLTAVVPQMAAKIEGFKYSGQEPHALFRVPVWRDRPTALEEETVQRIIDGFFGQGRESVPLSEILDQLARLPVDDQAQARDLATALAIQQFPEAFRLAGLGGIEGDRPAGAKQED